MPRPILRDMHCNHLGFGTLLNSEGCSRAHSGESQGRRARHDCGRYHSSAIDRARPNARHCWALVRRLLMSPSAAQQLRLEATYASSLTSFQQSPSTRTDEASVRVVQPPTVVPVKEPASYEATAGVV